ncbi:MAG TPA: SMEK domain-containing protein [Candidatus Wunengus sp. YC63]|uniref:SMEK domain-containing protein n=1 Tax=unclassified Candidatus Wunengus TaxID=3367695 RepID=UPI004027B9D0
MITRGIIIGKLIDDLSRLQGQIDFRCQVGLTDLNKYCEDFIKEVLNICYGLNLKNLNEDRANEPGLDLGDTKNKIAYQVTSTSTSEKVNNTLEVITSEQLKKYENIKVFILGKKQGTYDTVKDKLLKKCSFEISDIMDISDLCRQTISLKYDDLYDLYKLFEKEFQIVITEIEIPNKEGKYPTTLSDKLEIVPNTICQNAKKFLAEYKDNKLDDIITSFKELGKLPRVTRDFLEILIKTGENDVGNFEADYNELKRKLRIPEKELGEELGILIKRGFISEPDEGESSIRTQFNETQIEIIDFGIKNDCLTKLLVAMDFTLLDEEV